MKLSTLQTKKKKSLIPHKFKVLFLSTKFPSLSPLSSRSGSRWWSWPERSQPPEPQPSEDCRSAEADARRSQNPLRAEDEGADPEAAQEAAETALPAGRRHEEAAQQEQTVSLGYEEIRLWTGGSEKG